MPTEKETLLAVAEPEEWQEWIDDLIMGKLWFDLSQPCPFCIAFGWNGNTYTRPCQACMGYEDGSYPCNVSSEIRIYRSRSEKIFAALARLERAGIWE